MAAGKPRRPVVVKLAPDIAGDDLAPIVGVLAARAIDGIAVSNTTLAREGLGELAQAKEAGGLSGRPLFHRSTVMLARVQRLTAGRIPLIGIGGIDSGAAAIAKLEAGATLLQLYTGLVYEGPSLLARIERDLMDMSSERSSPASPGPPGGAPKTGRQGRSSAPAKLPAAGRQTSDSPVPAPLPQQRSRRSARFSLGHERSDKFPARAPAEAAQPAPSQAVEVPRGQAPPAAKFRGFAEAYATVKGAVSESRSDLGPEMAFCGRTAGQGAATAFATGLIAARPDLGQRRSGRPATSLRVSAAFPGSPRQRGQRGCGRASTPVRYHLAGFLMVVPGIGSGNNVSIDGLICLT